MPQLGVWSLVNFPFMNKFFVLTCLLVWVVSFNAQETVMIDLSKASLEEQYNELYNKSNNYQDYKVVKKVKINGFWKNVSDSLDLVYGKLVTGNKKINEQAAEINSLRSADNELKANIATLTEEKDGIDFMGSLWTKQKYKSTMWFLVFLLLGLLIFAIIRFLNSNRITRNTRAKLSGVEGEFEAFRKTAIHREQEIKRELQDYINKVADLTGGA